MRRAVKFSTLAVTVGIALSGCAVSSSHLAPGYGREVRADMVAQIADPDAHYTGDPAPASNGMRTASAQKRYETGTVTKPAQTQTSSVSVGGSGGQ